MGEENRLARIRQQVADRRFQDLVERASRLSETPPERTLKEGLGMIESAHTLQVRRE